MSLAWIRSRDSTLDIEDIAGTLARASRRREERHRLGNIFRENIDPQRRPLAIDFFQLVGSHAVGRRTFLSPPAVPDARPGQHRVRIDRVDADAELSALFSQAA